MLFKRETNACFLFYFHTDKIWANTFLTDGSVAQLVEPRSRKREHWITLLLKQNYIITVEI